MALLTGLVAKEMVVSSLSMFYGFPITAGGPEVAAAMTGFTPLSAFSMLVFILLYVPCVAATSTMFKEMNSPKWTAIAIGYMCLLAYCTSLVVYQLGGLITGEVSFNLFTVVAAALVALALWLLFRRNPYEENDGHTVIPVRKAAVRQ